MQTENKVNGTKELSKNILDKLEKLNLSKVGTKGSKQLYKDSAKLKSGQTYKEAKESMNTKVWRRMFRNEKEKICLAVLQSAKSKNAEETKKAVDNFVQWYNLNFIVNDFSLSSLTDSTKEENINFFSLVLEVVQSVKAK